MKGALFILTIASVARASPPEVDEGLMNFDTQLLQTDLSVETSMSDVPLISRIPSHLALKPEKHNTSLFSDELSHSVVTSDTPADFDDVTRLETDTAMPFVQTRASAYLLSAIVVILGVFLIVVITFGGMPWGRDDQSDEHQKSGPIQQTPYAQIVDNSLGWTRERIVIVALNSYNVFTWCVYYTVMVPLLPHYAEEYEFGAFGQGLVLGCLQIGWFLALPLVNTSYLKPYTMVCLGGVQYILAPTIVLIHPSLFTICAGRMIEGMGSCLLMVLMTGVMAREIPEEIRGFAFGVKGTLGALGLFVGPVVGGVLYPYGGIRLIMALLSTLSCLGLATYIAFMSDRWFVSFETRIASLEADGITMLARFKDLLREKLLAWLFCTHFASWFYVGMMFMAVPQFMVKDLALTAFMTTVFWLVCDMTKMVGTLVGGSLADYLKPWDMFFGGLTLQHVAMLALVLLTSQSTPSPQVFVFSCSSVFFFGTTEDGILGPSYMKMITLLETRLSANGDEDQNRDDSRFEEVFSMMEFVCAVALTLGPVYAGTVYPVGGFAMTLLGFTVFSAILNSCGAWGTCELRHMQDGNELSVFQQQASKFMGFPRDVSQGAALPAWLKEAATCSLINDGQAPKGLKLTLSTLEVEAEVIDTIAQRLYGAELGSYHGFLTNGGSMSNLEALLAARERFPLAMVFTCDRAHVSVKKACQVARMKLECLPAEHSLGSVSLSQLIDTLRANFEHIKENGVVVVLTQGYTFGGAEDDLDGLLRECDRHGITRQQMHIHLDAAFGGMFALARGFAQNHSLGVHYDSVCMSGQKFFGCPMPCSVLLMSNKVRTDTNDDEHVVEYIKAVKRTMSGSRSGWPALFLKYRLESQGVATVLKQASECLDLAAWFAAECKKMGIGCNYESAAPNVVLHLPVPASIVDRYSLMTVGENTQVMCMPHVTKALLQEFLSVVGSSACG